MVKHEQLYISDQNRTLLNLSLRRIFVYKFWHNMLVRRFVLLYTLDRDFEAIITRDTHYKLFNDYGNYNEET